MRRIVMLIGLAAALASRRVAAEPPPCAVEDVEYAMVANLKLSDTPMGKGDGVYVIGPGRAVLRFAGDHVEMRVYTMQEHFRIHASALFWSATVTTDAFSTATPNACSVAAEGTLDGRTLTWRTLVRGYRTDGTLTCEGSLCGKFGAPPEGRSPLHIGPEAVPFGPFVFAPDMKTWTMPLSPATKTEEPKQTSQVAVSAREVRRTCVAVAPCAAR